MSHNLDIREEQGYLHVRATGTRTLETVAEMAVEILKACIDRKIASVLVDVSDLEGRLSTIEAYEIPTSVFPKLRGLGLKRAAVVDRAEFQDDRPFFETVARNQGFNLYIFTDVDKAVAMLREGIDADSQ